MTNQAHYRQALAGSYRQYARALATVPEYDHLDQVSERQSSVTAVSTMEDIVGDLRGDEVVAECQLVSGGPLEVSSFNTPVAAGTQGEHHVRTGETWYVYGYDAIHSHQMIPSDEQILSADVRIRTYAPQQS